MTLSRVLELRYSLKRFFQQVLLSFAQGIRVEKMSGGFMRLDQSNFVAQPEKNQGFESRPDMLGGLCCKDVFRNQSLEPVQS